MPICAQWRKGDGPFTHAATVGGDFLPTPIKTAGVGPFPAAQLPHTRADGGFGCIHQGIAGALAALLRVPESAPRQVNASVDT
jgi:hypothetical protein